MDGLIYAYHLPNSAAQRKYAQAQVAKKLRERKLSEDSIGHVERTNSEKSSSQYSREVEILPLQRTRSVPQTSREPKDDAVGAMAEIKRADTGSLTSSSASSSHSNHAYESLLSNPFELRHGRRYLRDLPYPLPCDLQEIQRQNLATLLSCSVFGRVVCSPRVTTPRKVLEVGCGSAYWSTLCHDHFSKAGYKDVSFTGLDIAPLAPDLKKQGINWTFVQHDVRRIPLPFDDEQFDLIMLKDLSMCLPLGVPFQQFLDECIRLLREGGTLEIWESDHVLRSLLPHPPPPSSKQAKDQEIAVKTGTFLIGPGTPFAPAQNKYLNHANSWIQEALGRRKLPPIPCARIAQLLYQETDTLSDVGIRRIAIPLGELRWERDSHKHGRSQSAAEAKGKARVGEKSLTADQIALRQTALLIVVQMVESLESLLMDVAGKNTEEWSHWWASMMADLMDPNKGAASGECLEVGAWWAVKKTEE